VTDQTDHPYERQCQNCSAYVYPRERVGTYVWLPVNSESCARSALNHLHKVDGTYNISAKQAFDADQRSRATSSESAAPTEGTPGVKHPDPNLPSSHAKSCPLHSPEATGLEACSCGTGVLFGVPRPDLPVFCERCGLVVTAGPHGTWIDEESVTSDCPNYSGLHRVRGRTRTWAYDSSTLNGPGKFYVTGTEPAYTDHEQYGYTPAEAQTGPLEMPGFVGGFAIPTHQLYELIPHYPETNMDHGNDEPTAPDETPEGAAFQKRDEIAGLISQVIGDETEDELTPEQISEITLAAAEMLLSNYFMRAVER
jgi:hypothetical protein